MLRKVLMKILGPSRNLAADPTAQKLRNLVSVCSICSKGLQDHRYLQLATSFRETTVAEMLGLVRTHRWAQLLTLAEWNPEANALVAHAVAGPHEGGMVIAIKSSHDLYESDEVYLSETLPPDDMSNLAALLDGKTWLLL